MTYNFFLYFIMQLLTFIRKTVIVTFSKNWYTYVSKGVLLMGAIKFWGKTGEGMDRVWFPSGENLPHSFASFFFKSIKN